MSKKNKNGNGNGTNGNGHSKNGDGFKLNTLFKPKTINQSDYVRSMTEAHVVLCTGPPGSGKTACAVGLAMQWLTEGKIDKIVLSRPVVESGRGLGYLPGDFKDKIHPYLIPMLDELYKYLSEYQIKRLIQEDVIEIAPLEYMRGRNFHGSFMILDEAQNATTDQIKMFITRMGRDSTCIINGDLNQSDLETTEMGLKECMAKLDNMDIVAINALTHADIIRNPIIGEVLARLS